MTTFLFQRRCRLTVWPPPAEDFVELRPSARAFEGLRVQFKVKKTLKKEPNTCEVSISNLSEQSRALLQYKGAKFVLEAGYAHESPDNLVALTVPVFGSVFSGNIRYADHTRDGPNWVSKIRAGDGERAYGYARVNEALRPGAKVFDVAQMLARKLSPDVADGIERLKSMPDEFAGGYAACGRAADELDNILVSRGFDWSMQDGRVQILAQGSALPDVAIVLSAETGLIGSPEHGTPEKKSGRSLIKVQSLLRHTLAPGKRVEVRAEGLRGQLRVETVEHVGDTHGGEWYSNLECSELANE